MLSTDICIHVLFYVTHIFLSVNCACISRFDLMYVQHRLQGKIDFRYGVEIKDLLSFNSYNL